MSPAERRPRRVLVIAPHADDEAIGVGGTIARHAAEGDEVTVVVVTGHGNDEPHPLWPRSVWERVRAEACRACRVLGVKELVFDEVPAARVAEMPPWKLNRLIMDHVEKLQPEVLYAPWAFDVHADHREIFHALSVAWRPTTDVGQGIREIYCYETQSETHWNLPYGEAGFIPTCWVDIGPYLETKLQAAACYESQIRPAPDARSIEALRALAVWRGSQMRMAAAEAFVAVRLLR